MAVSGLIGRYNLARLRIEFIPPSEIYAGIETLGTIRLTNRKPWPSFLVVVEAADGQAFFPVVAARSAASRTLPIVMPRRGRARLPQGSFRSIFPVNFFIRSFPAEFDTETTVFPAPRTCDSARTPEGRRTGGEAESAQRGSDGEIERIAGYRGGEPLKMIHWKLSARHDELMIKETSDTSREPVTVDPDSLPGRDLEERLRCAAWLVNRYLKNDRPVGLQLPDRLIAPAAGNRQRLHLLMELALYGQDKVTA